MSSATAAPTGGVVPMTRRVMNLAHIATQNARRLAEHPAFIWGEKVLDWAEIDAQVSALAARPTKNPDRPKQPGTRCRYRIRHAS